MTRDQRRATRTALRDYNKLRDMAAGDRRTPEREQARRWCVAIEDALRYYDREEPTRAKLLRLRYIEHGHEEKVIEQLYVSRATYQRMDQDAVSTVAVFAAQRGAAL
jgi:hypothetical protein